MNDFSWLDELFRNAGLPGKEEDETSAQLQQAIIKRFEAEVLAARIQGRTDAIRCHSAIEAQWRIYRGSSNYLDFALEIINESRLNDDRLQQLKKGEDV